MRKLVVVVAVAALTATSCGGGEAPGSATETDSAAESTFGEPAPADAATRTVEVDALDKLAFDPPTISVGVGETVRFVVTNPGKAPHEFVLGDSAYQEEHEQAMEHGGHPTSIENAVEVGPGETQEITWKFTAPGEVLYACHVEGHYEGGMIGTVTVEG